MDFIFKFSFVTFSAILPLSHDKPAGIGGGNRSKWRKSPPNPVTGYFLTCPRWGSNPDSGEIHLAVSGSGAWALEVANSDKI